jgi:transketolase
MVYNKDLRIKIAQMVHRSHEGHIPSSFSIVDIIEVLYREILHYRPQEPQWEERDFFILSKGHGCGAFYAVLHKFGFLTDEDITKYSTADGRLGGHPDTTKVPGAEASTGSLGHGFPTALGVALGLRIKRRDNRVFALLGDGECQEGTIWESAHVAANRKLGNLCAIVDWNGSAAQLMPKDDLPNKWRTFGWDVFEVDGHDVVALGKLLKSLSFAAEGNPKAIIAHTVKGKGVSFVEGHGKWHHRIPTDEEMAAIVEELS